MSQELVPRTPPRPPDSGGGGGGARAALTGLARSAAGAWIRTAGWSLGVSFRLVRATGDPQAASAAAQDLVRDLQNLARELLGVSDLRLEERIKRLLPPAAAPVQARDKDGVMDPEALRNQAAELLRQAADVNFAQSAHPAYAQILLELAPDEARILRLLAAGGPQPAVDVRSTQLVGSGGVVAEGLNMIGAEAGVRHSDRVEAYLVNLTRLGLVRFSAKPLDDAITYQVLEAQPHVLEAVRGASRARTVHRSLRLTPFGQNFCDVCLPIDVEDIELSTE
jgi:Abortive infection alpha